MNERKTVYRFRAKNSPATVGLCFGVAHLKGWRAKQLDGLSCASLRTRWPPQSVWGAQESAKTRQQ